MDKNKCCVTEDGEQKSSEAGARARQLVAWLDSLPLNRNHWLVFSVCAAGLLFDAFDLLMVSFIAPEIMREWSLTPQALGVVISATVFGMLFGTYVLGTLSDVIGRRAGFQLTVAIFSFFSGLGAAAQNVMQFAAVRFCTGVGIGGFIPIDTAVMAEYLPARRRGALLALGAIFFPIGGFLAAGIAALVMPAFGWRGLLLIGVVPAVLILVFRRVVPETPRFLIAKGRLAEAERSIAWIARETPPPVTQPDVTATPDLVVARRWPAAELFSRTYRRRTVVAWSLWFFWAFPYYGLILWLPTLLTKFPNVPQATVFFYMMGFQIAGVTGRLVMLTLVDRLGRKPVIIGSGLCAGVLLLVFGWQQDLAGLILVGYLLAFFHDGGFSGIAPYTPELYPTHARSTGVGWASGAGRIGAMLAPIAVGFLVAAQSVYAVFVMFALSYWIAAAVVALIGVETKGQALE